MGVHEADLNALLLPPYEGDEPETELQEQDEVYVHRRGTHRTLCEASLALFMFGFVCAVFPLQLVSVCISFHLCRVRAIARSSRNVVIAFGIIEFCACLFLPSFVWYSHCEGVGPARKCAWVGWVSIVVWLLFGIIFGIPRAVITNGAQRNIAPVD